MSQVSAQELDKLIKIARDIARYAHDSYSRRQGRRMLKLLQREET